MQADHPGGKRGLPWQPPEENVTRHPRRTHMEILDPRGGDVWLLQEPVTIEEFKALKVDPPLFKSGLAAAAMDSAWFGRSPGADADGPLETRLIGGRRFARVARVRRFAGLPRGDAPALLSVEKHHVLGFEAGRRLVAALLPDGRYYIEQTEARPGRPFAPPADWKLCTLRIDAPWSLRLNCPASVYFFASLRSFCGPLAAGELPAAAEPLERAESATS